MKVQNITRYIIGTSLILLVPLVAMQFTDEVQWDVRDFIIIGTLLMGTGFVYELATTKTNPKYRGVIAVVLLAALLLVWAELAVGVFGSPIAGS